MTVIQGKHDGSGERECIIASNYRTSELRSNLSLAKIITSNTRKNN